MLNFASDYTEGCHPKVLEALGKTNMEQLGGYGSDAYTESAITKIKKEIKRPEAKVYFLTGGTQTNQVVISTMLQSYEGVVAATTGHVAAHEAGAIEYSGHKVLTIPSHEGKMDAGELKQYLTRFYEDENHEHMVFPGMVYISHPTEYGTLYTKEELQALSKICKSYEIPLYLDGARLGYGLKSKVSDMTLSDIAGLTDVFYIGGTKVGALCGEALVFPKGNTPGHFLTRIKQHGALLAKGRLLGIQFDVLFTENLYWEISKNAIDRAEELKAVLQEAGYPFYLDSPTNQQFVILPNEVLDKLSGKVGYSFWEAYDENSAVVRFATSWATTTEQIRALKEVLASI